LPYFSSLSFLQLYHFFGGKSTDDNLLKIGKKLLHFLQYFGIIISEFMQSFSYGCKNRGMKGKMNYVS